MGVSGVILEGEEDDLPGQPQEAFGGIVLLLLELVQAELLEGL